MRALLSDMCGSVSSKCTLHLCVISCCSRNDGFLYVKYLNMSMLGAL